MFVRGRIVREDTRSGFPWRVVGINIGTSPTTTGGCPDSYPMKTLRRPRHIFRGDIPDVEITRATSHRSA